MSTPSGFRYIIFTAIILLLLIQLSLYHRSIRFITASSLGERAKHFFITILGLLFASANIPLIGTVIIAMASGRFSLYSSSEMWGSVAPYVFYPLAVWHVGSVGSFLVVVLLDVLGGLGTWNRRLRAAESEAGPVQLSRRRFIKQIGSGLAVLPFGVSTYGAYVAREGATVERVAVRLPHLPEPLRGLTIVQLTDIHVGVFMSQQRLQEYVGVVNRLEPDLVVITGDFVSSSNQYVAPAVHALSHLRARLGVFGSIGNHEHYTDSISSLIEGFAQNNMKILLNEHAHVTVNGAKLNLIGIDYLGRNAAGFDEAIRAIPLDRPAILLSHQPNVFPQAAHRGIDLTLSGHTHGGQVNLDMLGMDIGPARLITPYVAGLYEMSQSKLYVSRGLGTTGPPVRINAPPEITQITLL